MPLYPQRRDRQRTWVTGMGTAAPSGPAVADGELSPSAAARACRHGFPPRLGMYRMETSSSRNVRAGGLWQELPQPAHAHLTLVVKRISSSTRLPRPGDVARSREANYWTQGARYQVIPICGFTHNDLARGGYRGPGPG